MIAWYQTKENCSIQHAGQTIEPTQKILLTEELAALHNSIAEQVIACEAPVDFTDSAVKSDFEEYEASKGERPFAPTASSKKSSTSTSTSTSTSAS